MNDLEAFSLHRTRGSGNQINIKDILLYINRLKFPNEDGTRSNTSLEYSTLAKNHLPLELIMELDANLKNTFKPNESDSDDYKEN